MNRGNAMFRENPEPGFSRTLSAARSWEPTLSAPPRKSAVLPAAPSHECSRPRRPQR